MRLTRLRASDHPLGRQKVHFARSFPYLSPSGKARCLRVAIVRCGDACLTKVSDFWGVFAWCGILDFCTAPRPLQAGSHWASFMFSEFLKFVLEKHNSCYRFFIDFLCFPSPRPMALRVETIRYGPCAPTISRAGSPASSPCQSRGAAERWSSPNDDEESCSAEGCSR
jgi:hypothetical protein